MHVSDLPAVNAGLNALATLLLVAGFAFIKSGRQQAHKTCMSAAFVVSCVFLSTYVVHKFLVHGIHTPIGAEGIVRTLYYTMLTSHVILAMGIVPLILVTIRHALAGRWDAHRAWAKWTFPLWLYVSVTGVLVYMMLYQWFPKA